jgi:hypothetical protein
MNTKITALAILYATNQVWGLKVNENTTDDLTGLENALNTASSTIKTGSQGSRRSGYCRGYYKGAKCYKKSDSDDSAASESDQCDAIMSFGYKNIFASSTATPDFLAVEDQPGDL